MNEEGFLGVFKECRICKKRVLCLVDGDSSPETHNKECEDKWIKLKGEDKK